MSIFSINNFQAHLVQPFSSSSRPQPLMSVDTSAVMEKCEARRVVEREQWRASCRGGRGQVVGREVESNYSSTYMEVKAGSGRGLGGVRAIGEGRQLMGWRGGREVSVLCVLFCIHPECCSLRVPMKICP